MTTSRNKRQTLIQLDDETIEQQKNQMPQLTFRDNQSNVGKTQQPKRPTLASPVTHGAPAPTAAMSNTGSGPSNPPSKNPSQKGPAPAPSAADALLQFENAKREAQYRAKKKSTATQRMINSMADNTVALLSRCMAQKIDEKVEIRIYKKPQKVEGGYIVAEYRSAAEKEEKDRKKKQSKDMAASKAENLSEDFTVVVAGELVADPEIDHVTNWVQYHTVVQKWSLWWRYCLAVHKRIGWKVNLERSLLNVVDSRVLGFVTVVIDSYVPT